MKRIKYIKLIKYIFLNLNIYLYTFIFALLFDGRLIDPTRLKKPFGKDCETLLIYLKIVVKYSKRY